MRIIGLLAVGLCGWLGLRWANSWARPGHELGPSAGRLADCPESPNCVSTTSPRAGQSMPPWPLTGSAESARRRLESAVVDMPGSRIVTSNETYLHIEFRSTLLGFIDDVELLIDESNGEIHFRSASRVGHSDLGVNRRRMEEIRRRYEEG